MSEVNIGLIIRDVEDERLYWATYADEFLSEFMVPHENILLSNLRNSEELTRFSIVIAPFIYPDEWSEERVKALICYLKTGGRLLLCGEIPDPLQKVVGVVEGARITSSGILKITLTDKGKEYLRDGRWEEGFLLVGGKPYVDGAAFDITAYKNVGGIELGVLEDPDSHDLLGTGIALNEYGSGLVLWFNGRPFWTIGSWSSDVYYFSDNSPWDWEKFKEMYSQAHKPIYTTKLALFSAIKCLLHSRRLPLITGAFWKAEGGHIPLGVLFGEHDFEPGGDIHKEQYLRDVLELDRSVGLPAAYMPTYDVITREAVEEIEAYGQELGIQTWKVSRGFRQIREEVERIHSICGRPLTSFDQHGDRPGGNTYFGMDYLLWMWRLGYKAHIESYHNYFDVYPFRPIYHDRSTGRLRLMETMYQLGGHTTVEDKSKPVREYVEEFRKFIERLRGIRIFLNHGVYYRKKAEWYREILAKIIRLDSWKVHPKKLFRWLTARRKIVLKYCKEEENKYTAYLTNNGEETIEGFVIEVYLPPGIQMERSAVNTRKCGDCLLVEVPKLKLSSTVKVKLCLSEAIS